MYKYRVVDLSDDLQRELNEWSAWKLVTLFKNDKGGFTAVFYTYFE